MALNVPTFFKRLGSSIVFVAIMLTGMLWNAWAFAVLVLVIQALCLRDYFRLAQKIDRDAQWPKWMPIVIQACSAAWLCGIFLTEIFFQKNTDIDSTIKSIGAPTAAVQTTDYVHIGRHLLGGYAIIFFSLFILGTILSKKDLLRTGMQCILGILYIVVPATLLLLLSNIHHMLPLIMMLMIWMNDTMAYLVGSFIGKTPFSPISPKKTWEGIIGGTVLTVAGAGVCGYCLPLIHGRYNISDALLLAGMGFMVSVAATLGDLLESKLKRLADVKDSGNLMPGHGGALDRFDSVLIATPFLYFLLYVVMAFI